MSEPVSPAPPTIRPNPVLKWVRANLVERTLRRLPKDNRVLDLCCGYGYYFTINPHAHGVDGDPAPVAELAARGFNVTRANVLERLPYDDGQFRDVIAHDVLEHFEYHELEHIVREVHRVLERGGTFWVLVPNRKGYDDGVDLEIGHKLFVTEKEMRSLATGLFTIDKNYSEPLPRKIGQRFKHNKEVFVLHRG